MRIETLVRQELSHLLCRLRERRLVQHSDPVGACGGLRDLVEEAAPDDDVVGRRTVDSDRDRLGHEVLPAVSSSANARMIRSATASGSPCASTSTPATAEYVSSRSASRER
ncbi:Uncharacterised protein [Mycobacteroides abscessus subsp. abscessus]|nr:Uncharacterised protein [Mycobacteroides abscessus subsp. abscessus]